MPFIAPFDVVAAASVAAGIKAAQEKQADKEDCIVLDSSEYQTLTEEQKQIESKNEPTASRGPTRVLSCAKHTERTS